ncbi:hypothetical protein QTO34_007408 [Cnephaeus nilssonii]|uniref:F-box/WD repeat-containing protein 12 n=1 Tax=Cnephaeus nilssonii TaxID=3371016 RepID=A0AA40HK70_CNENI|nr:hypothetical protein QTO34_007408 [Eptesicus nilssonii]
MEVAMEMEVEVQVQVPLPEVPMLHVFSFLDAASLLRAGQVSKPGVSWPLWCPLADSRRHVAVGPAPLTLGAVLFHERDNGAGVVLTGGSRSPGSPRVSQEAPSRSDRLCPRHGRGPRPGGRESGGGRVGLAPRTRWSLCRSRWRGPWEAPQVPAWKQLFLAQARRELRMARARPQDFSYREATGSLGILGPLAYLSGGGPSLTGQKSILCSASSRRMLYAWDVQEGSMIWSSPAQRATIKYLATLPQRSLAFTVDQEETVKVWNCRDAEPLATRSMPKRCFSLEPVLTDDGPILMVGDSEGDIYTLTVPRLDSVSLVHAFNYTVDHLHCSPNRKWVFAGGSHPHMMPKVFSAEGLLRPGDGAPLCASLPFAFCSQACWALRCANRVTMMFRRALFRRTGFSTFDLAARSPAGGTVVEAHQVASFMLPDGMESPFRMGVRDGATIVFESGSHLFLFSIHGGLLQRFDHHQDPICHLWMVRAPSSCRAQAPTGAAHPGSPPQDSLHVLTTSMDNYLHLYAWEEGGGSSRLRSCCHLEQRRADPTPSW